MLLEASRQTIISDAAHNSAKVQWTVKQSGKNSNHGAPVLWDYWWQDKPVKGIGQGRWAVLPWGKLKQQKKKSSQLQCWEEKNKTKTKNRH